MKVISERYPVILIALSSLLISVNGLMLRSIESANEWQVIFGRQLFFGPVILIFLIYRYRNRTIQIFKESGLIGLYAGLCLGLANPTIILAMTHTTVANALFTLSSCPLITSILAWIFLKEKISSRTIIAILIAVSGIGIMVADGLGGGTVYGNLLALSCAFFFSMFVIFLRVGKDRNMLPSTVIGAFIGILIGLVGANFDYKLSMHDGLLCLFWGGFIATTVHILFIQASRYVYGAEIMLITMIEFILGPVWVWIVFSEQPTILFAEPQDI